MSTSRDPWERKEAERARFEKKKGEPRDLFAELRDKQRPLVFLLCLAVLLACEVPRLSAGIRLGLTTLGAVSLLCSLALYASFSGTPGPFIKKLPNALLLLSVLQGLVLFFTAPDRGLATGELLRILSGACAFFFAAYALRGRREIGVFLAGLILLGVSIAIYDIAHFSQATGFNTHLSADKISIFGTHESVGTLLALLLPMLLAFVFSSVLEEKRRIATQAASLILIFAWIIVRCRSAWVGGAVGVAALVALLLRYDRPAAGGQRVVKQSWLARLVSSPLLILASALVFLGLAGGIAPLLSARLSTVTRLLEDGSVESRVEMWNGALRMLSERPVLGWGLGGYLLLQGEWTHLGDSKEQVLLYGTGHQNIAHNYYVQWAADSGAIGIFLFVSLLLSLLAIGLGALPSRMERFDRVVLIGALAVLLCGAVAVIGSPAFQFSGVWSVFWALVGLIVAVSREPDVSPRRSSGIVVMVVAAAVVGGLLWLGKRAWNPGSEPRGIFQLVEQTAGPYAPGDMIRWRASFRDGTGRARGTFPGTAWVEPAWFSPGQASAVKPLRSKDIRLQRIPFSASDLLQAGSELQLQLPLGETGMIQVQALYRDRFGREYTAMRVATVKPRDASVPKAR